MALSLRYLILSLLVCHAAGPLRSGALPSPDEPPARPLRFYYLNAPGRNVRESVPPVEFLLESAGEKVSCTLAPSSASDTLLYRGPLPVTVFREHKTEQGTQRETLGRIDFPAQWRGAFIIATRASDGEGAALRFFPVEYWGPSLPDHHARVVNLCPLPLAVKLAGGMASVPATGTADVDIADAVADLPVMLAMRQDAAWRMLLSSALPAPRRQRLLLLAFPDAAAPNRIRTLFLDDLPEPPPAKTTVASR